MISAKQKEFIQLWAISGKSIDSISSEINEEKSTLIKWEKQFKKEINSAKAEEYDKILENNSLSSINRFTYLCELYNRLKNELDKRDFSGLPTDKLYYILDDVYDLIKSIKENTNNEIK
ncbi:MAG: hypothetical protein D8M58_00400 [Calditrichaeota bacterium]|nr:MAG: hypothetical protein DWQ03_06680 [Calditrichota bacterium]MBL1203830.1 hypothetical protein [Calditrichota bacterium]NOG43661.1 hypothetical protein [Calditrichota bacterium]